MLINYITVIFTANFNLMPKWYLSSTLHSIQMHICTMYIMYNVFDVFYIFLCQQFTSFFIPKSCIVKLFSSPYINTNLILNYCICTNVCSAGMFCFLRLDSTINDEDMCTSPFLFSKVTTYLPRRQDV